MTKTSKICPSCGNQETTHDRILNNIELIKCTQCSLVYANISDQAILDFNSDYDGYTNEAYDGYQSWVDEFWFNYVAKKLTRYFPAPGTVLDVGCGNGLLLKQFIELGWQAEGVDVSDWSNTAAEKIGFKFYQGELEKLNLPVDTYDLIVSSSTLEHVAQPREFVKAITKVLKPGGWAYFIGMPNHNSWSIQLGISSFYSNIPPMHVNYLTYKSSMALLEEDKVGKLSQKIIRTYGIPEIFAIYHRLMQKRSSKTKNAAASPNTNKPSPQKRSQLKQFLGKAFILFYYTMGRPFRLGGKVEILFQK